MDWNLLTDEQFREYVFPTHTVRIVNPIKLNVSKSGGHRIYSADGMSHYIPTGWCHLRWLVKPGKPEFAF